MWGWGSGCVRVGMCRGRVGMLGHHVPPRLFRRAPQTDIRTGVLGGETL